jgi:threonine/homoserine/homoserine lactone efflux protein
MAIPEIDTLLTFALAALLLSLSPGPSNLYIMARTIGQGRETGTAAACGMALGTFCYVIATALGISAIFQYSPAAYTVVKLLGAGYLIYLGTQLVFNPTSKIEQKSHLKALAIKSVFRQSIIVEITNPKTALFFIAFLPQFADPQIGSIAVQLVIFGTLYAIIAFCSDLLVVTVSSSLGKWLSHHPSFVQWQERFSGTILIGLGGYLAFEEWATPATESS